jgi:hypothetical protein
MRVGQPSDRPAPDVARLSDLRGLTEQLGMETQRLISAYRDLLCQALSLGSLSNFSWWMRSFCATHLAWRYRLLSRRMATPLPSFRASPNFCAWHLISGVSGVWGIAFVPGTSFRSFCASPSFLCLALSSGSFGDSGRLGVCHLALSRRLTRGARDHPVSADRPAIGRCFCAWHLVPGV